MPSDGQLCVCGGGNDSTHVSESKKLRQCDGAEEDDNHPGKLTDGSSVTLTGKKASLRVLAVRGMLARGRRILCEQASDSR